jgi:hypothetical protein
LTILHTMAPIQKGVMDPNTYMTLIIGHTSAQTYGGVVMRIKFNGYIERMGLRAPTLTIILACLIGSKQLV